MHAFLDAFRWRYQSYVEPYRVACGGPVSFLRRSVENLRARGAEAPVAYVYANPTNAGDFASALGVRMLAAHPGIALHCDAVAVPRTLRTLDDGPDVGRTWSAVVVGGGGLLQQCFDDFWRGLLAGNRPFVVFGIGANAALPVRQLSASDVLTGIAQRAAAIHVRDEFTASLLIAHGARRVTVGLCPSVNYVHAAVSTIRRERRTLLHVVHEVDLRMAGGDIRRLRARLQSAAETLGLSYEETDHMQGVDRSLLGRYARATVVVSSRLHGCIFALASHKPFVAIACDRKTTAFVDTHAPRARCESARRS